MREDIPAFGQITSDAIDYGVLFLRNNQLVWVLRIARKKNLADTVLFVLRRRDNKGFYSKLTLNSDLHFFACGHQ